MAKSNTAIRADAHDMGRPSEWVARWAAHIEPGGAVLDLACGSGRHCRFLTARGLRVWAVDRDPQAIESVRNIAGVTALLADLESGLWPFQNQQFAGVVVTNYLHRPLFTRILDALTPAGVLIYETFALGNERFGKPSNPDFLLRPGELLELARGNLRVVAYEDLEVRTPKPARIQRICASGRSAGA